jgi:peptidoglycan/xylan/chitin deacetylase (PgdA/CDA1 family)
MLEEGHAVGLHCEQHVRYSDHDQAWCARDADRGLERLQELGVTVQLWRTPWGDTPPFARAVATERGLRLVGWMVDTHDWRGDRAPEMFAATQPGLRPGAIVLAHDGIGPGALRDDTTETVNYTELVLAHAERHGLRLEALA